MKFSNLFSLKNLWRVNFFTLLTLLLGIAFAAKPDLIDDVCRGTGTLLAIAGAVLAVIHFVKGRTKVHFLITGILLILAGFFLVFVTTILKTLVPILFGLWLLINSFDNIVRAYQSKPFVKHWWIGMLLSILSCAVGVFVITRPVKAITYTIRLIGIAMIVHSVLQLCSAFFEKRPKSEKPSDGIIETTIEES